MARIRSVHPALFTDEAWVSCSPFARLLVIGLWTDADDQGVFEWKPLQIKMRLMPGDTADVPALLAELVSAGLIAPFEVSGKRYGAVRNFRKFQRPKKPNALHPLPADVRGYVCISEPGSEVCADDEGEVPPEAEPVPHQFPTSSEIAPQMEDGGGRVEVKEEEANASLSAPADVTGKYPDVFEACWKAYPHIKGRSSKTKSFAHWRRIPVTIRPLLLGAIERYSVNGREPTAECGAPAMERWIRDSRYLDWLVADEPSVALARTFPGPDEIRAAVVSAKGEDFTRSWLDRCEWDDEAQAVVSTSALVVDRLRKEVGSLLTAQHVHIERKAA